MQERMKIGRMELEIMTPLEDIWGEDGTRNLIQVERMSRIPKVRERVQELCGAMGNAGFDVGDIAAFSFALGYLVGLRSERRLGA